MKKFINLFFVAVFLAAPSFLIASNVYSQETGSGGIGGRPAFPRDDNPRSESIFVHTIEPGSTVEDGIKVINNSGETKTVSVYATDSINSSGGAFACKQKSEENTDVGQWISLQKQSVTIEPAEFEIVPFTITVPGDASVGEHNGCVVVQEEKPADNPEQGIGLSFRTAIRTAVLIPGEIEKNVTILDFTSMVNDEKIVLTPKVLNSGNVSVDADVETTVSYPFGVSLSSAGGEFPILRDQETTWNFEHDRPFWGGFVKTNLSIEYDANTNSFLGDTPQSDPEKISYSGGWIFIMPQPLALASYLLFIALVVLGSLYAVKSAKQRRNIKKSWTSYKVTSGDDIKSIAKKHDIHWKKLAKTNKLKAPYTLESGKSIKVPSPKKEDAKK